MERILNAGMDLTAPNIKKFIAERNAVEEIKPADLTDQISSGYMKTVQEMLAQSGLPKMTTGKKHHSRPHCYGTGLFMKKLHRRRRAMDSGNLLLDERFHLLLHKKIMDKKGSAMRRAKKYYKDQYKKTGIIPGPLCLRKKALWRVENAAVVLVP